MIFTATTIQGSFTAPEDLSLRAALFTIVVPGEPFGAFVYTTVSFDPELDRENGIGFQLLLTSYDRDPITRFAFANLDVPLLKGTTLYWGSGASDLTIQLILVKFTAELLS